MSIFKNKNVLITGAAGICGQSAVSRMLSEEANVRAVVYNRRTIEFEHDNLEVVKADLSLYDDCVNVIKDIDIVLHFAAHIRGAQGQQEEQVALVTKNVVPSVNMLDVSVNNNVEYFGFINSSTAYPDVSYPVKETEMFDGNPFVGYTGVGWMKRYLQKVIEYFQTLNKTKFGVVVPMAVYGPRDNFNHYGHAIPQLIMKASDGMNPFEIWGDGSQVRQFIYVDDLIDSLLYVLEKDPSGIPYNVGTGASTTITELVETITEIYDYQPKFNYDTTKPSMITKRELDVTKITDLGWKPKHDLRSGLEKTINWYEDKITA